MALTLRAAARSDVGLVRRGNEDSGYAGSHLLAVADGMGGHAAGELASACAIASIWDLDTSDLTTADVLPALTGAVDEASRAISEVSEADPEVAGLGTTMTAIYWSGTRIAIVHVGDSRAYLLRDGELQQLSHDHTYVQTLVDSGRISSDEAAHHPRRNLLMRTLDGSHPVEADLSVREARVGDRFLVCSDGLTGVVPDDELTRLLSDGEPTGIVTRLVDSALERGAPDNVTVVVADLVEGDPTVTQTPVVVGAAGEPRVRSRLPQVTFPPDAQPDPDRPPAPPPVEGPPTSEQPAVTADIPPRRRTARPRRRWGVPMAIAAAVIAGIAIIVLASLTWVRSQWYVGDSGGYVAIYQGLQGSLAGMPLQSVAQTTTLPVTDLPLFDRELVAKGIPAANLSDAQRISDELVRRAAACKVPNPPAGCPTSVLP